MKLYNLAYFVVPLDVVNVQAYHAIKKQLKGANMPQVKNVEKKIQKIEGFKVHFLHSGKNVRSDAELPVQYASKKMAKNSYTVSDFKNKIQRQYAGYEFDVLKADGKKASGQTKLSTVRDTYLPEEE